MELMTEKKKGFKKTEVGLIPIDWELKRIGDLAPLQRGFDLPKYRLKKGSYPVVYSNGIQNFHNEYMVKGPGVVTGRSGTLGNLTYVEDDYWPHNTALWVTEFNYNHPKYIYYLYGHIGLDKFGSGSGVPTLNRNDVHDHKVAIPPTLAEQQAIATALSDVDELIYSLDALIQKKEGIKKGTMQQLLTGKKRLPGFDGEWEVINIGEIFEFKNGLNKAKQFFGKGTPIINYMDVFNYSGLKEEDIQGKVTLTKSEIRRFNVQKGDVFFTRTSETVDEIGISTVLEEDIENGVFSGFILRGRPKNKKLSLKFKRYCFSSDVVRNQIVGMATYTTRALTNGRQLSKVNLPIPPTIKEQKAIAKILSNMDQEIQVLRRKRKKFVQIKQGMMQELLTGRVRLV